MFIFSLQFILISMMLFIILGVLSFKEVHPLGMGMVMLLETLLMILILNLFNKTSFYSMIIYLIMIGGMLILFLYFNMFAINVKMIFNFNNMYNLLLMIMLISGFILMLMNYDKMSLILFLNDQLIEMKNLSLDKNNYSLISVYVKFSSLIIYMLVYLLYVLVLIVKVLFFYNPKSMRRMV